MSEDQMRVEFEEWLCSEGRTPRDDYKEAMWHAWQASRKALCVELPETFDKRDVQGIDYDAMLAALDKAGVAYK